jgi:ATP/maltotriose-dependent transcriptional regulator MalT
MGSLLLLRVELHLLSGRTAEARADLREARQHLRNTSAPQFALPLAAVEAELARSEGDLDAAQAIVQRALARATGGEEPRYRWPVLSLGARIEAERARDLGADALQDAGQRGAALLFQAEALEVRTPAARGHLALVRAEHARLMRSGEVTAWSGAADACRSMNEPFLLAYALLRQAEAMVSAQHFADAGRAAREASELALAMGAAPLLGEIDTLIRSARLQSEEQWAPIPAASGDVVDDRFGLTAREREVLQLVADGRSNGEIAERLVISRATASVHVSHILSKLGVDSRVQAATLAHRRGLVSAHGEDHNPA